MRLPHKNLTRENLCYLAISNTVINLCYESIKTLAILQISQNITTLLCP